MDDTTEVLLIGFAIYIFIYLICYKKDFSFRFEEWLMRAQKIAFFKFCVPFFGISFGILAGSIKKNELSLFLIAISICSYIYGKHIENKKD